MEEFIGKVWHRLLTRRVADQYEFAQVNLEDLKQQLTLYYRGLGGDAGKMFVPSQARHFSSARRLIQRIAGTHDRHAVSWQDDEYISLPPTINFFPDSELNESLYFWLTAMAVKLPLIRHWFPDNQQACVDLLQERPGLKKIYQQLVQATLDSRIPLQELQGTEKLREEALREALLNPGSVVQLPLAKGDPQPVWLWLYAPPLRAVSVQADDETNDSARIETKNTQTSNTRKQARRIDDSKETDGLLLFQAESLMSWAEQVELDRCQEEDQDEELQTAAEDLDIVTLSRQRRTGSAKIKFDLDLPAAHNDDLPLGDGIRFPEWNYRKSMLVKDYCLLQPMLADQAEPACVPKHLTFIANRIKKQFSVLQTQRTLQKHQSFGEEIDLDTWLRTVTQPVQDINRQDYYQTRRISQRDVACLLLADLSLSTDAMITEEQSIIDIIKDTLLLFAEALDDAGDKFGIYGFSSVKNTHVRYHILKNFRETYGDTVRGRIMATIPGFYTRMGAAIRQSTEILKIQSAQQRLLMVISDGKPNDIDQYEGRYGIEDTRHAIIEARQQGLHPYCITIDNGANDYLPYLFGDKNFVIVDDVSKLPQILPRLYLKLTTKNS